MLNPVAFIFMMVVLPVVFILLVWVATMAYRICVPEKPQPLAHDPVIVRELARKVGEPVAVGFREIRDDQRRHNQLERVEYHYQRGELGNTIPVAWLQEMQERCN
ncbi:MAG: hypothetical protein AAF752_12195 [Bacteroidota bacterium]